MEAPKEGGTSETVSDGAPALAKFCSLSLGDVAVGRVCTELIMLFISASCIAAVERRVKRGRVFHQWMHGDLWCFYKLLSVCLDESLFLLHEPFLRIFKRFSEGVEDGIQFLFVFLFFPNSVWVVPD